MRTARRWVLRDGLNFHNTARYELLLNREFMRGASHKAIRYVYTRRYWGNSVTKRRDYLRRCTLLSTAISHHQTSIYFDKRTINLGFNLANVSFGSNTQTTFHKQIENLYGYVAGVNSVHRFKISYTRRMTVKSYGERCVVVHPSRYLKNPVARTTIDDHIKV